jgi:CYTH domain-containing protein/predicted ATPase
MIVLTGGPCSGKSSSLAYLTEKLSDHGFMVFVIPETATLITDNGIDRRKMDRQRQVVLYEEAILDMQLAFEETYRNAVSRIFPERRKIVLLDRGVMDIKAFVPKADFKEMLKKKGLKEINVRDRYNGVIHLVTAAEGAQEFYTGDNNTARLETADEAIRIDRAIRESWLGHPHFKLIDNRTDFEGKIKRTFDAIMQLLGLPAFPVKEERFIVKEIDYAQLPAHQTIEIEQVYLRSRNPDEEIYIKKRGQDGTHLYFLTRTRTSGMRIKEEELISEQQYGNLKKLIDPKTDALAKERICFLWNHEHYELDRYAGRHSGVAVLKTERSSEGRADTAAEQMPPFITAGENITSSPRYNERTMALARKPGAARPRKHT